MITALLIWLVGTIVILVGTMFPESEPGAVADQAADGVGYVMGLASGFGVWLPFGTVATCAAALLGVYLVGFGIRLIRVVASFVTGGGGSAA